ncbi:MAG: pseudouridine synthase [Bacteriovoracaceae bacterium]
MDNPLKVLYQDEDFVVTHKSSGLLVHPERRGQMKETLMGKLRDQLGLTLFPLHRLDRPVSGLVWFCLNKEIVPKAQLYWHHQSTLKWYIALVKGEPEESGQFCTPMEGEKNKGSKKKHFKLANTLYWKIHSFKEENCSLMLVLIRTGRHHQIRRHFRRFFFPLIGDTKYGKGEINRRFREKYNFQRIFLHCYQVNYFHPNDKQEKIVKAEALEDLQDLLKTLLKDETQNFEGLIDRVQKQILNFKPPKDFDTFFKSKSFGNKN